MLGLLLPRAASWSTVAVAVTIITNQSIARLEDCSPSCFVVVGLLSKTRPKGSWSYGR